MKAIDVDVDALDVAELPAVLGQVVELEARIRLRLAGAVTPAASPTAADRLIDAAAAASLAGTSTRWVLRATRGLSFRKDLSRKLPRFDEAGLRGWLLNRRRR